MRLHRDLAFLAVALTLFVGACFIVAETDKTDAQAAVAPTTKTEVSEDIPEEDEAVVSADVDEGLTAEEEETIRMEAERIEETLIEQGYYRDDIPLSYLEQDFLHAAADEFGIDYYIMVALIERETRFNNIYGDGGNAYGYCQIWPKWWSGLMAEIGAEDLNEPQDNFRTAAAILAQHLERYGSMRDALTAYNTGRPGESEYASEVLANAEKWRAQANG